MVWSDPFDVAAPEAHVDEVGRLAEMGATWTPSDVDTSSFPAFLDGLRAWGEVRAQHGLRAPVGGCRRPGKLDKC